MKVGELGTGSTSLIISIPLYRIRESTTGSTVSSHTRVSLGRGHFETGSDLQPVTPSQALLEVKDITRWSTSKGYGLDKRVVQGLAKGER